MPEITPLAIIHMGLQRLSLPPLTRPAIGPTEEPTEELVDWSAQYYAYSVIAHVRTILAGLVLLFENRNAPTGYLACRHIYEWTAHASYIAEKLKALKSQKLWTPAFEMFFRADSGNLWVKRYGVKYGFDVNSEDVPNPFAVRDLISEYEKYQLAEYGEQDARDGYGFLSEHAHANGVCFLAYREICGSQVRFVESPEESPPAGINACLIEWLMLVEKVLAMSREKAVREGVLSILKTLAALERLERGRKDVSE